MRALLVAAAAGLALVPAALSALRADAFTASFEVGVVEDARFELPGGPVGYVRELLRDPALGRRTVALSGLPIDDASVRARVGLRAADGAVRIDVRERTPDRARELAAALRDALGRTGRAAFRAEAAARRRSIRSRLKSPLTTPEERRRLIERARALPSFFRARPTRLVLGAPPLRPRPDRALDRAADALPGRYPPAPAPLGASAAGLAVALLLIPQLRLARPRFARAAAPRPRRPRTARRRSLR
jgi:hypothetical protein